MNGSGKFKNSRSSLSDLEAAAQDRRVDAEKLFNGRRYASTIAMAIYALEIELKVAICERLELDGLPQALETHDLDTLLIMSGLKRSLDRHDFSRIKYNWEQLVSINDNIRQGKLSDLRYSPSDRYSRQQAKDVFKQLFDQTDGVIPWITAQQQCLRGARSQTP